MEGMIQKAAPAPRLHPVTAVSPGSSMLSKQQKQVKSY